MSAASESESKVDEIIRRFLEKYEGFRKMRSETTTHDMAEIYNILQESELLPRLVIKVQKSDQESEKIRAAGNTAYKMKNFDEALLSYTRAICCAKLGGEPIALAWANRSAVHFELQAYDDAIKDINHALATGKYPEDMKHKLFERRAKSYLALSQYQKALEDIKNVLSHLTNNELDKGKVMSHPMDGTVEQEKVISDLINGTSNQGKGKSHSPFCDLDLGKIISKFASGDLDQEKIIFHLMNGQSDREKALRIKTLVDLIAKCMGKPNPPWEKPTEAKLSHKPTKNSKGAFPAMEVAISPEMGKHVVASANISPADILALEKPYVSVLTPEFYSFFCDNCKTRCHASIPCVHCTNVVFCSETCRREGWESHHSVECDLLPTAIDLGCKVNILIGIRGLLKATRCGKDLQRFVDEYINESKAKGCKPKEKVKAPKTNKSPNNNHLDEYHSVHNLVTHEQDRSEVQILGAMATVCCVVHILKGASGFFGSSCTQKSPLSLNHIVAANLISRYFMMAGCNAFEIGESNFTPCGDFTDCEFRIIGGALYPTFCLLNHSCDPNVSAYMSNEETRIMYAIKPIRKSEQLFISYGPDYVHHDLPTRRKELKSKYFFTCECLACLNNWPVANNLPEYPTFISYRVESAQASRIFDTCKKLSEIVLAADKGPISHEQFQLAVQFLSLYHKYVIPPWKYYFAAQRVIRRYFSYKGKHNISKMGSISFPPAAYRSDENAQ